MLSPTEKYKIKAKPVPGQSGAGFVVQEPLGPREMKKRVEVPFFVLTKKSC